MVARVREHCVPLRAAEVDTVILGCTHYPLIRGMIQRELGRDVALVSAAEELAEEVAATLARKRIAREHGRRGSYRFACTGDAEAFASVGRRFLQLPISSVRPLGASELAGLALTT
jgi:glutamate racemase